MRNLVPNASSRIARAREAMRARLVGPVRRPPTSMLVQDPGVDLSGRADLMDMLTRRYGEQAGAVAAYLQPPTQEVADPMAEFSSDEDEFGGGI